ncbi:hypothetical protein ACFQFQ_25780 [Sulfitobacter porphyrae]|uniref:Uncharacterized protein n=1 Tax=Sulfitobacter porphyrae TaxID=1246864 RepID=A0ABW2BAB2_9RHOB
MARAPRHVLDFNDPSVTAVESTVSDPAIVDQPYSARSWRHFQRPENGPWRASGRPRRIWNALTATMMSCAICWKDGCA